VAALTVAAAGAGVAAGAATVRKYLPLATDLNETEPSAFLIKLNFSLIFYQNNMLFNFVVYKK